MLSSKGGNLLACSSFHIPSFYAMTLMSCRSHGNGIQFTKMAENELGQNKYILGVNLFLDKYSSVKVFQLHLCCFHSVLA